MEVKSLPKQTFYNLPQAKQDLIFQTALAEFARHPYEEASLSEIVSRLGIAKGSMYQYFHNKKDLYKHVVQQVYQHKKQYMQPVWRMREQNFFALVSAYYRQSWRYALAHPVHHQVIANFWDSRDAKLQQEIVREKQVRNMEFFDLLEQATARGEVTPDLDSQAAWFVYHAVGRALVDNFLNTAIDAQAHEEFIDSVLALLEQGLLPRKEK